MVRAQCDKRATVEPKLTTPAKVAAVNGPWHMRGKNELLDVTSQKQLK